MTTRMMLGAAALLAGLAAAMPAWAHAGGGHATFLDGALHPIGGADHLAAMIAVGLWAGLVGGVRRWVWPASFVAAMIAGAVAGWYALPAPGIETAIALSVVALGVAIASNWSPAIVVGVVAIAAFGAAHGVAHGAEMPGEHLLNAYAAGVIVATAVLHAAGLAIAVALGGGMAQRLAPRLAGGTLALLGVVLVAGTLVA